ncbi:glutathione peroxidase [Pirellulaceae bacterium SH501]
MTDIYQFQAQSIDGTPLQLERYRGRVLLIVNVASHCVFTKQYDALQDLHARYSDLGLSVLGFPCNQFGNQEPGTNEEVKSFCEMNYKVGFDLFAKVDVNGPKADPIFQFLKSEAPGLFGSEAIKWNFTKFLVGRDGKVIRRYSSMTTPKQLESDIESALNENA